MTPNEKAALRRLNESGLESSEAEDWKFSGWVIGLVVAVIAIPIYLVASLL